jgi:hypothetical protein
MIISNKAGNYIELALLIVAIVTVVFTFFTSDITAKLCYNDKEVEDVITKDDFSDYTDSALTTYINDINKILESNASSNNKTNELTNKTIKYKSCFNNMYALLKGFPPLCQYT